MEYLIITALQLLGVCFHIGQKIMQLDSTHPDDSLQDVWNAFWKADRITVFISALILLLNLIVQFIINNYAMDILYQNKNFHLYMFGAALVLGYAGQNLIYKFMGTAERFLGKKIDSIDK